jgi:hypothetical protein
MRQAVTGASINAVSCFAFLDARGGKACRFTLAGLSPRTQRPRPRDRFPRARCFPRTRFPRRRHSRRPLGDRGLRPVCSYPRKISTVMAASDLADRGSGPDRLTGGSRGRSLPSGTWRHVSEAHVRFIPVATVPIPSFERPSLRPSPFLAPSRDPAFQVSSGELEYRPNRSTGWAYRQEIGPRNCRTPAQLHV